MPAGSSREVLVATRSIGKIRELMPLLHHLGYTPVSLSDANIPHEAAEDALEAFPTFEENATAKALWFWARSGGRAVIADDSGLEVQALHGQPGVHSKRWAGVTCSTGAELEAENNAHLLRELQASGVPEPWLARYVCAAVGVSSQGRCVVRGSSDGTIVESPRGNGGFGYDPYFESIHYRQTFAEVGAEEKAAVSHRGRAFRDLAARASEWLMPG